LHAEGEVLAKPGLADWRERLRLPAAGDAPALYLKRYVRPPRTAAAAARRSGWDARSLAGVEWNVLQALTRAGIATIEPIAMGEALDRTRERFSAILTAAVPGDSLERLLMDRPADVTARRRELIAATAALAARLHGAGLVHRDFYLSHLFVDLDRPGTVYLIDVQRVFRPRRWRMARWIVKDLAALNYSAPPGLVRRGDRVQWLQAYLGVSKLDAPGRRLGRRVAAKTRRIARHDAARQRRLRSGSNAG